MPTLVRRPPSGARSAVQQGAGPVAAPSLPPQVVEAPPAHAGQAGRGPLQAACLRSDAQHKASTEIVRRAACVVVEDLNVGGMVKNRRLSRAVSDAGMSGFVSKLRYKCAAHGVRLVQADRWFASTKLCCSCGRVQAMPLTVRTYSCDCGMVLDRDLNAARNLEGYAAGSSVGGAKRTWRPCKAAFGRQRPAKRQRKH